MSFEPIYFSYVFTENKDYFFPQNQTHNQQLLQMHHLMFKEKYLSCCKKVKIIYLRAYFICLDI